MWKKWIVCSAFLWIALFVFAGCKCEDGAHEYVAEVKTAASCTEEGVRKYKCSICGDSYTEPIEKLEHDYVESVQDPTCTEEGVRTFTCSLCGDVYTEPIGKLEHDYVESVKDPTCTKEGVKTFTCSLCGDTYTETISMIDHKYKESVRKQPTCTEDGVRAFVCSLCGDTNTESIASTGHDWIAATCTKPRTCSRCGKTEGSALQHTFENGRCVACGVSAPTYTLNDAVNRGYIDVDVVMSSIKDGRINARNRTQDYLYVTIPAGSYFVANSTSNQNMLVTSTKSFSLEPGASTTEYVPTACMNIHRDIPNERAGYTVGYTNDATLQNLVKLFEQNNTSYYVRQAAVWIVTDDATYADTGTLSVNGRKAISQADYNEAQRLVSQARGY